MPGENPLVGKRAIIAHRFSSPRLENDFQLDRGAEWKTRNAIYQAARVLVLAENILQQLRSRVGNFRLIAHISRSGH